jgi:branched-chain amino acid transport system substrate-binding protein
MRKIAALLALTGLVFAVAPVGAAPKRTIVFGAAVALTGSLANEGQLTREGYDFWMRYVNNNGGLRVGDQMYPVEIRYADDQSDPQLTAKLLESMIVDQHVDFILGPYGSAENFTAAAVAERHAIPMVDSAGAAENIFNQGYKYTFAVLSPARKYLVGMIEYAVRRTPRPRTVAIVAANDPFSLEVQQGAVQSANDHGLQVVYADHYGSSSDDVAASAAAIKAVQPDVVLVAGHLKDSLQFHRALKERHIAAKIYGYTNGPDTPEFRVTLGNDAQAVLGSAQWSPAVTYYGEGGFYRTGKAYATAFTREVGHAPDYHNAQATAGALVFGYALQRAGTLDPAAVRDALSKVDLMTFFGQVKFDARGVNMWKPMVVNQIQGAQLLTIYPYRLADAKPIYPSPSWH